MPDPREDEELEAFLRRFEPRAPSPLPRRGSRRAWWALAAASLVAGALWVGWPAGAPVPKPAAITPALPAPETRSRPTMAELSVVLRPGGSTRAMDRLEGRVLADPRRHGGALRVMATAAPGS